MIVFPAFCKPFVCKATKIVKGERSGKRKTKFFKLDSSEPRPSLWKDSERQVERQTKNKVFQVRLFRASFWFWRDSERFQGSYFLRILQFSFFRVSYRIFFIGYKIFLPSCGKIFVSIPFAIKKKTIFDAVIGSFTLCILKNKP